MKGRNYNSQALTPMQKPVIPDPEPSPECSPWFWQARMRESSALPGDAVLLDGPLEEPYLRPALGEVVDFERPIAIRSTPEYHSNW